MSNKRSTPRPKADEFHTVLTNGHCRIILSYFQNSPDDVASLQDLADVIKNQDGSEGRQVAVQLHHSTLPRLADVGAIDYDPRSNTVRYHGHAELEQKMAAVATH